NDQVVAASQVHLEFENALAQWKPAQGAPVAYEILGHTVTKYDGVAFKGKPIGQKLDQYGALTRSESLVFTDAILDNAYGSLRPGYLDGNAALPAGAPATFGAKT